MTQRQKFHTDDTNQCLHDKVRQSWGSKYIFVQFYVSSGRFWKVLCSSVNELQQILNASSREDYIPQALTGLLEILRVYI